MKLYENECRYYRNLNKVAKYNGVVLFGSSFAKQIPVSELRQDFELNYNIYNRSITDLSVFDAASVLNDCVLDLYPDKVLIQLGETDLEQGFRTIDEITAQYELIVNQIRSRQKGCQITIVSVCDEGNGLYPEQLNKKLEQLAGRLGCAFADISAALSSESPDVKAFSLLKRFFRDRNNDEMLHLVFA